MEYYEALKYLPEVEYEEIPSEVHFDIKQNPDNYKFFDYDWITHFMFSMLYFKHGYINQGIKGLTGGVCYIKGKEKGVWYEIRCVKDVIISKESKGQDASFERRLLKAWSKYPGYESAKKALRECPNAVLLGVSNQNPATLR